MENEELIKYLDSLIELKKHCLEEEQDTQNVDAHIKSVTKKIDERMENEPKELQINGFHTERG